MEIKILLVKETTVEKFYFLVGVLSSFVASPMDMYFDYDDKIIIIKIVEDFDVKDRILNILREYPVERYTYKVYSEEREAKATKEYFKKAFDGINVNMPANGQIERFMKEINFEPSEEVREIVLETFRLSTEMPRITFNKVVNAAVRKVRKKERGEMFAKVRNEIRAFQDKHAKLFSMTEKISFTAVWRAYASCFQS